VPEPEWDRRAELLPCWTWSERGPYSLRFHSSWDTMCQQFWDTPS
jgi:hypothetical protein